jgi:NTP pyrophosphatase (non-canonical NTP hydrolase)
VKLTGDKYFWKIYKEYGKMSTEDVRGWDDLRPDLQEFVLDMERVLRANDYKGGWKDCFATQMADRIDEELDELFDELDEDYPSTENTMKEAVDVANMAMMVWDITRLSKNVAS